MCTDKILTSFHVPPAIIDNLKVEGVCIEVILPQEDVYTPRLAMRFPVRSCSKWHCRSILRGMSYRFVRRYAFYIRTVYI